MQLETAYPSTNPADPQPGYSHMGAQPPAFREMAATKSGTETREL